MANRIVLRVSSADANILSCLHNPIFTILLFPRHSRPNFSVQPTFSRKSSNKWEQRSPPVRALSIFQLPCISIFVDDVEMDAKRGGKLEIFLSPGDATRRRASRAAFHQPRQPSMSHKRRKREKGRRRKNERVRNVRKRCRALLRNKNFRAGRRM